jgi:cytochrome c biogenesis protein CcmG/thiol:disulfide interchange protein DsbE
MTSADQTSGNVAKGRSRPRLLLLLPLLFFVALAAVFFLRLEWGGDPGLVPSPLIGHPAPEFTLPPLAGLNLPGLSRADLTGHVTLVNVFASWCVPCRDEHPALTALAKDPRFRIVGINYKDNPDDAKRFLTDLGNPYSAIGVDAAGRASIDWGVYGVPETFIVGPDGIIDGKVIGPLDDDTIAGTLMPAVDKALKTAAAAPPPTASPAPHT